MRENQIVPALKRNQPVEGGKIDSCAPFIGVHA
jgi:hypothetical protein